MTLTTLRLSDPYGKLAFREAGSGQPIVLIHGVGMQSAAWMRQIEMLSKTHRVIALDMPGHGGSSPLRRGAQLPEYVDWLQAALRGLRLERISLAGHSMGALIALGFAATHTQMLDRVAVLNGVYCRSKNARAAVEERAAQINEGVFDLATPLARWFGDTPCEQIAREKVAGWLSEVDLQGYATAYDAFARGDTTYADRLGNITCPLLALTGSDDQNSSPEMARSIAAAAPLGQALVIEGHRHMVSLTAEEAVNTALQEWLETKQKVEAQ
ncbi:AB hydrolase superfamily protein YdjP [Shimia sp. SK013]|uniref:alpha/beta fold hydrolase n=1 Tax=Shimia sp. SK013 TaxID=1389006 RepID=UPI0006B554DE|nr:alpha/beta hydrolase [Shimia sp. SK013]KPA21158.1 AB hydrolase superfamily protein YdjP [Shimia sp. SK013]